MKLFYDDEFDALAQTITNSSKEFKQCAAFLFPAMKPESQYAKLKACLNPEKGERLTFGQIVALCRFCESYDALHFMSDELMHSRPVKREPEDEKARLQREYVEAVGTLKRISDRMEKLPLMRAA